MKISFKIGLLFFIAIFLVEAISMSFLHNNIIHTRVQNELSALQTRGNNHREILEGSFNNETMKHIALMESKTDTQVVLTDDKGTIFLSSNLANTEMRKIINETPKKIPYSGLILEDDWKNDVYIASISPVKINGKVNGYVYMFQSTQKIKQLISELNRHFMLAGALLLIFMFIIIFFLTRFVTYPIIQMNEATKRISKGDFSVSLPRLGNDEIGELGESIQILANDLDTIKNERNEFLASISHELRTPLTYIKGYADIARRPSISSDERDNYLDIIFEETLKLSNLVKDLFNLAKLDENDFSIEKETVELFPYFKTIQEKISPAFKEENRKLHLVCSEDMYAKIDPIRFEQVIVNLLDNARKYSNPNTVVTMHVKERAGKISVSIEDYGKGIPSEDLPRIFERFYRVDKSRTRTLGGSGLGLAIVKQLVEAHGGEIKVESTPGIGTTFEILLEKDVDWF